VLTAGRTPGAVVADTAYDSDRLRAWAASVGATAVIPPSPLRSLKPLFDRELYAERNAAERYFGRLKLNRRLATRYEKTSRNSLGFAQWATTLVLLR
jgi:transposase